MRIVYQIKDVVKRLDDKAHGEVTAKLAGNHYVVLWPNRTYSKHHATELQFVV